MHLEPTWPPQTQMLVAGRGALLKAQTEDSIKPGTENLSFINPFILMIVSNSWHWERTRENERERQEQGDLAIWSLFTQWLQVWSPRRRRGQWAARARRASVEQRSSPAPWPPAWPACAPFCLSTTPSSACPSTAAWLSAYPHSGLPAIPNANPKDTLLWKHVQ